MTSFNNNSSQKQRREVLANDRANASTLHEFAQSEAGEISGRWAKPTQVSGSEGAVHMPRLPSNSPWAAPDPCGQEQPYPVDLSEPPEPVGTAQEIEDSLQPFSWLRRDGAPDHPTQGSPVIPDVVDAGAPPATAAAPSSSGTPRPEGDLGEVPHVSEGQHSAGNGDRQTRMLPQNIRRRLR
jgi:hypothetical protein